MDRGDSRKRGGQSFAIPHSVPNLVHFGMPHRVGFWPSRDVDVPHSLGSALSFDNSINLSESRSLQVALDRLSQSIAVYRSDGRCFGQAGMAAAVAGRPHRLEKPGSIRPGRRARVLLDEEERDWEDNIEEDDAGLDLTSRVYVAVDELVLHSHSFAAVMFDRNLQSTPPPLQVFVSLRC